ncbi:relaxase domain-containing protein [Micrococcus luteus]|uniref:MobF family relaxase n=1 Tax=Micrococcus luteus TaxID=1270 RepID=UPI00214F72DA|nr:MobF family relaxase [Micrococcus luteus]MCR4487694.1 relaxase domain-containing protein [Micrococcus luteus]MCV7504187.1 relaxase domain-containing protein [Micrococcus luteus]
MTVSISKMSIDYYLDSVATGDRSVSADGAATARRDLTAYYTEAKAPPGTWLGRGLAGTSLTAGQQVAKADAVSVYELAKDPDTGTPLGRSPIREVAAPEGATTPAGRTAKATRKPVAGFDLTFSVPKSVSTLWTMSGPAMQGQIQAAHQQAMAEALAWVEDNVLQSRAGHGGVAHVPVTGLVASAFDHWDSRAGDPQLHTHVVVSNRVQRLMDGQWATLDSYTLHRHVVAISEKYNALLYDRLHGQIGALAESRDPAITAALEQVLSGQELEQDTVAGHGVHRVELAGVPDTLIEEFSTRSRLIQARKDELIAQWEAAHGRTAPAAVVLKLRQQATLETRTPKKESTETLAEKMVGWRDRALAGGHDPAAIVAAAVGHDRRTVTADQLTDQAREALAVWVLTDASVRRTTFTRANVLASAERVLALVRFDTAEDRHAAADELVDTALAQAVSLTPDRMTAPAKFDPVLSAPTGRSGLDHKRVAGTWTTGQVIDDEAYLMGRVRSAGAPVIDPDTLAGQVAEVTTKDGHRLSADQAAATSHVLSSPSGIDAIIGPAGTGKTTTMAAVAQLWHAQHGQGSVVGLAPSAVAAGVLADELGVATENTAKWLWESVGDGAAARAQRVAGLQDRLAQLWDAPASDARIRQIEAATARLAEEHAIQARFTLHPGQLLIVDEASMVATAQMAELARQAEAAGAKVLLVGDPAQLEAVEAGGFLGWMDRADDVPVARLDQVWRFRNEWERSASLHLREGDHDVLEQYEAAGRLHGHPEVDAADTAYAAWLSDKREGLSTILIASDNATVADLNTRAQADLVTAGLVDVETTVTLRADVTAGVGDELLARRNDRSLRDSTGSFIANGTRLTLTGINPDGSAEAVLDATGGTVILDPDYLASSTELGYATTAHRSQGVTVDTGHTVVEAGQSRELLYVAMTRGRMANHAYVNLEPDEHASPDEWGLLHRTPGAQTPVGALKAVLDHSTAERSAHEVQAGERAWANDLGRLVHEYEFLDWASRAERTGAWIDRSFPDPATNAAMREAETWNRMVKADPARTFSGELDQVQTPKDVIGQCQSRLPPSPLDRPAPDPAEGTRAAAVAEVHEHLHAELAHQAATVRAEPPAWAAHMAGWNQSEATLHAVLLWRAVSNQNEHTASVLGRPPAANDATAHHYRRALDALTGSHDDEAIIASLTENHLHLARVIDLPHGLAPSIDVGPQRHGPARPDSAGFQRGCV